MKEARLLLQHKISPREALLPPDAEPTLAAKKDLLYLKGGLREHEARYAAVVEA